MARRTCRLCGGEFEGRINTLYCPECKKVTCPICGKEFDGSPNSKVCQDCKTQVCPCCGKEFKLTYHAREQIKKNGYATCSRSCGMKMSHECGDFKSEDGFARTCMVCGKEFIGNSKNTWYCDDCRVQPCIVCGKSDAC